ncbi:MAG: aspartate kinase [Gammaproteobacteria bacterium]|nr:aspartate kinase [Gammaproteobacteria bacterium]
MSLVVQKYGGTSVGDTDRIESVAETIFATREQGHDLVVVLSAMAGETDRLLGLARSVSYPNRPNPRELDVALASGEQVTIALLCMALEKRGITGRSFTAMQAGVLTDNTHTRARILGVDSTLLRENIERGRVPVVAGFQGVDEDGNITTLGRGGSDTTAVAVAAALGADECQIYTDVPGVFTTDPRVEPKARRLDRLTFEEMLELAGQGSKVLQTRAVEFAGKYNVPLRVLSAFEKGPGTFIAGGNNDMETAVISGIAFSREEAEVTVLGVPDEPGAAHRILGPIADAGISVDMIVQNVAKDGLIDFTFTIGRNDYAEALEILEQNRESIGAAGLSGGDRVAKISLVGVGVRSHADIAARMFRVLGGEGVNIHMISTSEVKISAVIAEEHLEQSVRALHEAFELDQQSQTTAGQLGESPRMDKVSG